MSTLASRIHQARRNAALTQMQLAAHLGVNRSAVAQWERRGGSRPTSENLAKIAVATKVNFDWLATGRGKSTLHGDGAEETPALELKFFARNDSEERILLAFRRMSERKQEALLDLLDSKSA
jgi:transcriptional regulator with XRE-family HTH domain